MTLSLFSFTFLFVVFLSFPFFLRSQFYLSSPSTCYFRCSLYYWRESFTLREKNFQCHDWLIQYTWFYHQFSFFVFLCLCSFAYLTPAAALPPSISYTSPLIDTHFLRHVLLQSCNWFTAMLHTYFLFIEAISCGWPVASAQFLIDKSMLQLLLPPPFPRCRCYYYYWHGRHSRLRRRCPRCRHRRHCRQFDSI